MAIYTFEITELEGEYTADIAALFGEKGDTGTTDYNELINKPDLTLKADKTYVDTQDTSVASTAQSNLTAHTSNTANPHSVTKAQVGLSNVPNLDTTAAVANQHTHANKAVLDATTASFTTADETKLDGIATGAQVNTVTSVAGKTGAVTLAKGDVGLGNADNTSDMNKPVSTAQQTALDGKVNRTSLARRLYGTNDSSAQVTFPYADLAAENWSIVGRNGSGQIVTATPTSAGHAVTKAYVDARTPIYGSGFPNGVVSAPVGSKYIDTAATNGALEWMKASGTGNTGWVVSVGDTGWRNIPLTDPDASGSLMYRRINNDVDIRAVSILMPAGSSYYTLAGSLNPGIPVGFRLVSSSQFTQGFFVTSSDVWNRIVIFNGHQVYWYSKINKNTVDLVRPTGAMNGQFTYRCLDVWPTTLPGTAA